MTEPTDLEEAAYWAEEAAAAVRARDESIRRAREGGATLRAIADAAGLSHTQVANILKKEQQ